MSLSSVPDVDIDPKGVFKYILIQVTDKTTKDKKFIVRGYYRCHFHADIFDEVKAGIPNELKLKCVGGGRIKHDDTDKNILVYGYSQGYGRADHQVAVDILKKKYDDYEITFSNEGY